MVLLAAASSAALWLLVGLAGGALTWSASTSRYGVVIDAVLPPTLPSSTLAQPAPWDLVQPALVVAMVAALVATGMAVLARRSSWSTSARAPRFCAVWLVVVVAADVTAALWTVGTAVAVPGPNGYVWALRDAVPAMLATGWFGVVWGWLPALWALRDDTGTSTDTAPVTTSRTPGIVAGAVALVLAVVLVAVQPTIDRDARVAAGGTPDGEPTATPTTTPRPAPPAPVATDAEAPGADWCATDDVQLSLSAVDGALGHRAMSVVLLNRSTSACVVDGFPDVAFAAEDGAAVPVPLDHGASYLGGAATPSAVTVAPGGSAVAALAWGAGGTGEAVATFWIAPYAGASRTPLAADTDLAADATVTVSAWATPVTSAG